MLYRAVTCSSFSSHYYRPYPLPSFCLHTFTSTTACPLSQDKHSTVHSSRSLPPSLPPTVLPRIFQAGTTNSNALLNMMQLSSFHRLQSHNCVDTLICLFQYPYLLSSQYLLLFHTHNYLCLVSKFHTCTPFLMTGP